jgi:hypothetical protein
VDAGTSISAEEEAEMQTAKRILALTLMFVVVAAVSVSAQQQAAPAAPKDVKSLAGKWKGFATPASGSGFPVEVQVQPDGSYTAMMGATSGRGTIKMEGGKFMAEGHLSGPAGVAAGAGKSQLTVSTKAGKQVMSGAGRNDAGPFNYELTKE